jgi:hypothetical protein
MATLSRTEREIQHLTAKLASLHAENRQLRKKMKRHSPQHRQLTRAEHAALAILQAHFGGYSITRRTMRRYFGISERQWSWGRALLMVAGLHNGETVPETIDSATAVRLLRVEVSRLEESNDLSVLERHHGYRS